LFGGDWHRPEWHRYLIDNDLLTTIPWAPSQVFVNGYSTDDTMDFLEAVRANEGRTVIVCNGRVAIVSISAMATPIIAPAANAWSAVHSLYMTLRDTLKSGDLVLYAAGMTSNVLAHRLHGAVPGSMHIDVGCAFDGAAGIISRGWQRYPDEIRCRRFNEIYKPWLLPT